MFFKTAETVFKDYLQRNVYQKTWFYTSINGATLVMQAWYALAAMQKLKHNFRLGSRLQAWNVHPEHPQSCLVFTDRSELWEAVERKRQVGSVAGTEHEFELFRQHFVVWPHALLVPNRDRLNETRPHPYSLGLMSDPDDFLRVVAEANKICARALSDFR